jgi:hypothetical protein
MQFLRNAHNNTLYDGLLQAESTAFRTHPAVLNKIREFIEAGLRVAADIRVLVESFVKTDLLKGKECPSPLDRRFFLTDDIIRNIIYK